MKYLNLLTSSEDELRVAFDAVEGEGSNYYDRSSNPYRVTPLLYTIKNFWDEYQRLEDEGKLENFPEDEPVSIVYGFFLNRYFCYKDGTIVFSDLDAHGHDADAVRIKARLAGFKTQAYGGRPTFQRVSGLLLISGKFVRIQGWGGKHLEESEHEGPVMLEILGTEGDHFVCKNETGLLLLRIRNIGDIEVELDEDASEVA